MPVAAEEKNHLEHPRHRLHLDGVSVRLGSEDILKNITFTLNCGDIVALIGPNGGGKSTLLKAITGEIPSQGLIRFHDTQGHAVSRPCIGYMPQQLIFDRKAPLTVADLLGAHRSRWPVFLGTPKRTRRELLQRLERVKASHLIDRRLGDLSGGELQRVTLAFALDPVPDILLLDEPVSAMDESGRALFYQLVRELRDDFDLLTLVVSHDLDVISSYADRLIHLNRTIISQGPVEDFLAPDRSLRTKTVSSKEAST